MDATISQGAITHTWAGYRYAQFSDWVSIFHGGTGQIVITDHGTGKTLLTTSIPLTPGPLVVVIKDLCASTTTTSRLRVSVIGSIARGTQRLNCSMSGSIQRLNCSMGPVDSVVFNVTGIERA